MTDTGDAPIRVLIADDQAIIRDGLATILGLLPDIEVVGTAPDGREAVALAVQRHPDVVLMDLRMPVLDGVGATAQLRADVPTAAVLVLTTFSDDESIVKALRAGARGYLTKDAGRVELAAAIRSVARGQRTFGASVGDAVIGAMTAAPTASAPDPAAGIQIRFPMLTPREAEVLAAMAEGLGNTAIAERQYVSVATVKTHINAIFGKLGVRDRAAAIALARGDTPPTP